MLISRYDALIDTADKRCRHAFARIPGGRHMECAYYFAKILGGRHMECAYYFNLGRLCLMLMQ